MGNGTGGSGTGQGGSFQGAGGAGGNGGSSNVTNACAASVLAVSNPIISNFDDPADMGLAVTAVEPGGKWSLDRDGSTGTASLAVEDSGSTDQKKAAHFQGAGLTVWGADMAATLSGPTTPIDGSKFSGISFKLKTGVTNKATSVIIKLQNADSLPACGMCDPKDTAAKACYAGYVTTANITGTGWQSVQVAWPTVKAATWGGFHSGVVVDPKQLFIIAIALDKGQDFDLWIDDVAFYP
jgi:hypothetical protein